MGVLIPFNSGRHGRLPEDTEEVQILSEKHKTVLKNRLHNLTKLVTNKDLGIIRSQTLKKAEAVTGSKEYIRKLVLRVKIMHQMLFDSEYPKSEASRKILAAGLLYFISPNDFLEDDIPGLGYLDDAYIIRETWGKRLKEIKAYLSIKGIDENLYI